MIIIAKLDKEYVNKKIANCQHLVDNARSEAQREIYQGYLDFWNEKLPKAQRPEIIAKKEEEKEAKEALEAIAAALAITEEKAIEEATLETERLAKEKADKIAKLKAELEAIEGNPKPEPLSQLDKHIINNEPLGRLPEPNFVKAEDAKITLIFNERDFEELFPNKKAYRTQNGERIKTIAYKEYLNNSKSESE